MAAVVVDANVLIRQARCVCACTRAGADKILCDGTALLKFSNSDRDRVIEPYQSSESGRSSPTETLV